MILHTRTAILPDMVRMPDRSEANNRIHISTTIAFFSSATISKENCTNHIPAPLFSLLLQKKITFPIAAQSSSQIHQKQTIESIERPEATIILISNAGILLDIASKSDRLEAKEQTSYQHLPSLLSPQRPKASTILNTIYQHHHPAI